jgi:hypothetical protein
MRMTEGKQAEIPGVDLPERHQPLVTWLYEGWYAEHTDLLRSSGLLPVAMGVVSVMSAPLKACKRSGLGVFAYAVSAPFCLVRFPNEAKRT